MLGNLISIPTGHKSYRFEEVNRSLRVEERNYES